MIGENGRQRYVVYFQLYFHKLRVKFDTYTFRTSLNECINQPVLQFCLQTSIYCQIRPKLWPVSHLSVARLLYIEIITKYEVLCALYVYLQHHWLMQVYHNKLYCLYLLRLFKIHAYQHFGLNGFQASCTTNPNRDTSSAERQICEKKHWQMTQKCQSEGI